MTLKAGETHKTTKQIEKKCKFSNKIAKICDIKKLKTIPWQKKFH